VLDHASRLLVCPRSTNWPHMRARGPFFRILRSKGRAAPAFKLDGAALALFPERAVKLKRARTARGDGDRAAARERGAGAGEGGGRLLFRVGARLCHL